MNKTSESARLSKNFEGRSLYERPLSPIADKARLLFNSYLPSDAGIVARLSRFPRVPTWRFPRRAKPVENPVSQGNSFGTSSNSAGISGPKILRSSARRKKNRCISENLVDQSLFAPFLNGIPPSSFFGNPLFHYGCGNEASGHTVADSRRRAGLPDTPRSHKGGQGLRRSR